jgi:hypothetical protein
MKIRIRQMKNILDKGKKQQLIINLKLKKKKRKNLWYNKIKLKIIRQI